MTFEEFKNQFKTGDRIMLKNGPPVNSDYRGKKGHIHKIGDQTIEFKLDDDPSNEIFYANYSSLVKCIKPNYFK